MAGRTSRSSCPKSGTKHTFWLCRLLSLEPWWRIITLLMLLRINWRRDLEVAIQFGCFQLFFTLCRLVGSWHKWSDSYFSRDKGCVWTILSWFSIAMFYLRRRKNLMMLVPCLPFWKYFNYTLFLSNYTLLSPMKSRICASRYVAEADKARQTLNINLLS